jgi:hypothetical protein
MGCGSGSNCSIRTLIKRKALGREVFEVKWAQTSAIESGSWPIGAARGRSKPVQWFQMMKEVLIAALAFDLDGAVVLASRSRQNVCRTDHRLPTMRKWKQAQIPVAPCINAQWQWLLCGRPEAAGLLKITGG